MTMDVRKMETSELIMELVAGCVVVLTEDRPRVTFTMGRSFRDLERRKILAKEIDRRMPRSG